MPGRLSDMDKGLWTLDPQDSKRDLFPDAPDRLHAMYDTSYDICDLIVQEDERMTSRKRSARRRKIFTHH